MADETETTTETTETGAETQTEATTETTSSGAETNAAETTEETTALGKKEGAAETETPALPEILGAPEGDYTITAPEGLTFDKEAFDAVAPVLKEMNLSDKGAQQIVTAYAEKVLPLIEQRVQAQIQEQSQIATAQYKKEWLDEAKADPEIGGAKWDESLAIAGKVFDKVGLKASDPFRALLEDSGLGNHPDAVRFMRRVGALIGEDRFERGEGDHTQDTRPIHDRIYGGPTTAAT